MCYYFSFLNFNKHRKEQKKNKNKNKNKIYSIKEFFHNFFSYIKRNSTFECFMHVIKTLNNGIWVSRNKSFVHCSLSNNYPLPNLFIYEWDYVGDFQFRVNYFFETFGLCSWVGCVVKIKKALLDNYSKFEIILSTLLLYEFNWLVIVSTFNYLGLGR